MHSSSCLITPGVRMLATIGFLLVSFPAAAHAERLPLKAYATADRLAHNEINKIVRDSRGLLWFCTVKPDSHSDWPNNSARTSSHGINSTVPRRPPLCVR
jgi:hypothetical protein